MTPMAPTTFDQVEEATFSVCCNRVGAWTMEILREQIGQK